MVFSCCLGASSAALNSISSISQREAAALQKTGNFALDGKRSGLRKIRPCRRCAAKGNRVNAVQETPADGGAAEMRLPPVETRQMTDFSFEFTGNATEYFRIWIVNLALSIVTLGIYSAWAKVRTQRYFYANTRVAGAPFEYLARPIPILKGRLIAFVLFGGYVLSGHISFRVQIALALLIAIVSPWLIVRGLKFRARYSAWRSINFSFHGGYGDAYVNYLFLYVLVPLTLFIYYPFLKGRQKRYVVDHHQYGTQALHFNALNGEFFPPYLGAFGMMFVWYLMVSIGTAMLVLGGHNASRHPNPTMIYVMVVVLYLGVFLVAAFISARINNIVYNNIDIGGNRLFSTLRARDLIGIYTVNTLAILCSVGLLVPWAMIRLARYRASRLTLLSAGNLDTFTAAPTSDVGAAGSEVDAVFDIDIGF